MSRAGSCKPDNRQFTEKQFSKPERYPEEHLSKYTILYFHAHFTHIESDHRDTSILDDLHPVKAQLGAQVRNSPICFCLLGPCPAEGTRAARGEAQVLQVHVERTRTLTGQRPARSLGPLPLLRPHPDLSLSVLYHHGLLCLWP